MADGLQGVVFDLFGTLIVTSAADVLENRRLLAAGRLAVRAPARPRLKAPPVGHWNYLHGPASLVARLATELKARLPFTEAIVLSNSTLAFAGSLQTMGQIGLGFEDEAAVSGAF